MKKFLSLMLALTIVFSLAGIASAAQEIKIMVGGEILEPMVAPAITNGRVMLPVRDVFESIDARVSYDSSTRTVTAVRKGVTVQFVIDSNIMKINGIEKEIDVPATIVNGRTLVPLRACAEAFDLDVTWNQNTRTARVKKAVSLIVESTSPNSQYVHRYTYDENGNETSWTNSVNDSTVYEYTEDGKMLYRESKNSSHTNWVRRNYDIHGNLIYDEQGSAKNEDFEPGMVGQVTTYTYDENSNLLKTESKYETASYEYDAYGRLLKKTYSDGLSDLYTYDSNGNLTITQAYGGTSTFTYDANGNLLTMEAGEAVERNKYDGYGRLIESYYAFGDMGETSYYKYDDNGRLIYEETPGGISQYTYNEYGKVLTETTDYGTIYYYTYDADGNLIQEESSDGYWKKYTNDENGNCIQTETNYGGIDKYIVVVK